MRRLVHNGLDISVEWDHAGVLTVTHDPPVYRCTVELDAPGDRVEWTMRREQFVKTGLRCDEPVRVEFHTELTSIKVGPVVEKRRARS
jgi:hypothetical protein